jgi:hypothetical protein
VSTDGGDGLGPAGGSREVLAAHAVRKVRRVPDDHREFSVSAADAARLHRIGPDLLELLLDLGLPHRGDDAGRHFDPLDLGNVGLTLRRSPRWVAMRWWPRSLRECGVAGKLTHRLTVKVACPTPGETHRCELAAHPRALAAADPASLRRSAEGFTLRLNTTSIDHVFGPPFDALIERVVPVEYHLIPEALADDLGFVTATGLADCRLAARLLVHAGAELNLRVRPAQGLLLATPFPGWHTWVEFHTGGRWLAADPFLLSNLHRWGLLDAGQWPAGRSPHGILGRWHRELPPLVTHCGVPVQPELALSRQPDHHEISH